MSAKKVTFGSRPAGPGHAAATADDWVAAGGETAQSTSSAPAPKEPFKRMTFDVPEDLHRLVKAECARRGTTIRDEVLRLLRAEFEGKS